MTTLDFGLLRAMNALRCDTAFGHGGDTWSPTDWACAAAGEMGEACNLIKKLRRGEDIPTREIAHEIADTVIYLDLLALRMGIDLGEAVREKFNIVSTRVGSSAWL